MDLKLVLTIIGVGLTIIAPLPYIRDIIRGKTKPHIITWLIWTLLVGTAFVFQIIGGGGLGSLVLGVTALMNLVILFLSLRNSKNPITRFDIVILGLALLALIAWRITNNPLLSVILITAIQAIGLIPTFRKSIMQPEQETISLYAMSAIKQAVGIAALSAYNVLTLLFPLVSLILNLGLVSMLVVRRRSLR